MKFGSQKSLFHYIYSWPTVLLLIVLVVLMSVSVWSRYRVERKMAEREKEVQIEQERLQQREDELTKKVEYLAGERGIEEELRRNFDVAKPGEEVVVITGAGEVVIETSTEPELEDVSWWQFWR